MGGDVAVDSEMSMMISSVSKPIRWFSLLEVFIEIECAYVRLYSTKK